MVVKQTRNRRLKLQERTVGASKRRK